MGLSRDSVKLTHHAVFFRSLPHRIAVDEVAYWRGWLPFGQRDAQARAHATSREIASRGCTRQAALRPANGPQPKLHGQGPRAEAARRAACHVRDAISGARDVRRRAAVQIGYARGAPAPTRSRAVTASG